MRERERGGDRQREGTRAGKEKGVEKERWERMRGHVEKMKRWSKRERESSRVEKE